MHIEEQAKNAIIWIDDLLTTKDRQGTGLLGDSEIGYCCLGKGATVLGITHLLDDDYSLDLMLSTGLRTIGGFFVDSCDPSSLTEANDDYGWSFSKIGAFMRDNPHEMFVPEVADLIAKHYKQ